MIYEVIRSEEFDSDMDGVIEYLVEEALAKAAANNLISHIEHAEELLRDNPCMFPVSNKPLLRNRGYREYFIDNYAIIYKVTGSTIALLRLFHQKELYELKA